jgi:hypothetical protein
MLLTHASEMSGLIAPGGYSDSGEEKVVALSG